MEIRMLTNLFRGSRMSGVVIPEAGESVDLPTADAARLLVPLHGVTHAEPVAREAPEVAAVAPSENAAAKRGRPRKVEG